MENKSTRIACCDERLRLLNELIQAVDDLVSIHQQQLASLAGGDPDASRFELLIHVATEKKHRAKYAHISHVKTHGCAIPIELPTAA